MARNKNRQDSQHLIISDDVKIMGSNEAVKALCLKAKKYELGLDDISFISWKDCKWSHGELMSLEKMDSTDCFCLAVRKAGEMNAWLVAESFVDLKEEFDEIFKNICAIENKTLLTDTRTFNSVTKGLKSHIAVFDSEGETPSRTLTQRMSDTFVRGKRKITFGKLTIASGIKFGDEHLSHLFVKGDAKIEDKREQEESQRALKQKFLSSISGNIDVELLNYANNRVNERINNDKRLKNSLDLSFISIGTNWETRDCAGVEGGSETPGKEAQFAFMKTIIDAIVNRCNVEIDYRPHGYGLMTCEVSPHRLRKDRQWIIFGYSAAVVDSVRQSGLFSFKLGRIYGVRRIPGEYIGDDDDGIKRIYKNISCNQVTYDVLQGNPELQKVVIAVKGKFNDGGLHGRAFAYNKINEEKIHRTQKEISREEVVLLGYSDAIKDLENWGFFEFEIYDYDRIAYRLLQYQANLKVIAPYSLRDIMRKISEELYNLYH